MFRKGKNTYFFKETSDYRIVFIILLIINLLQQLACVLLFHC